MRSIAAAATARGGDDGTRLFTISTIALNPHLAYQAAEGEGEETRGTASVPSSEDFRLLPPTCPP